MLVGKTGVGKSSAGNTILAEERFKSELGSSSVTAECELQQAVVFGRNVSVIKIPCLFDGTMCKEMLSEKIVTSIHLFSPGPHAFLYVQPVNVRFTEQEKNDFEKFEMIFGREIKKYTIFLFTYADMLEGKTVDMVIQENRTLSRLVDECGGGYHVFNNKDLGNRNQVSELLEKIDRMVEKNGGTCYSSPEAQDERSKSVREIIQSFERKNKRMREQPERKEQTRMRIKIPDTFRTEEKNRRKESEGVEGEEEEEEEEVRGNNVRGEVITEHFLTQGQEEESEEAFNDSVSADADGDEYRNPVLSALTKTEEPEKFRTEEKIRRESEGDETEEEEEEIRGSKGFRVRGEREEHENRSGHVANRNDYEDTVLTVLGVLLSSVLIVGAGALIASFKK